MVTLKRRGSVWWIQYREGGRRVRKSLRTKNRKVAEELRLRAEFEIGQRKLGLVPPESVDKEVEPEPEVPSVEAIRAEYAEWSTSRKRPKTILNDKARLKRFFESVPDKAFTEIKTADVERFLTAEAKRGCSPATQLRNREILHALWRWAERQGYVDRNVVSDIPRPRLPERDPVFLNLEQIDELLAAVKGSTIEALVAAAVFAGLRREELCWLTWDDVELDDDRGVLRIRAKRVRGESWQPKTKRDRKVPIGRRLRPVLIGHCDKGREKGVRWLFPSPQRCRWDPDNLSREFRKVMKAGDLSWNLQELRHTFGSQLARKGVSLLKIARLMGNSPMIASKHYINLVAEDMADDVAF